MARRLADGPLSAEQAIQYGLSLAQELKRRHQTGVVTGSLHPDRIALNGASASILETKDTGISRYSSPEQWEGKAPDNRSDVFSFGAILYEFLTGHRALEGNNPEEWKASLDRREAAPSNGVSPDIAYLLGRCLKLRPEQRWQNVSAVVIELKLLAASERHARAAAEWKRWIASVQNEVGEVGGRLAAHETANDAALSEIKTAIGQVALKNQEHLAAAASTSQTLSDLDHTVAAANQTLGSLTLSVRDLSSRTEDHARTIESIQSAVTQTDEVIDHVVDAFDSMHRLVIERAEAGAAVASHRSS